MTSAGQRHYLPAVILNKIREGIKKIFRSLYKSVYKKEMVHCGKNVRFDPLSSYITYDKLSVGDDVYIGHGATLRGFLTIGNHCLFGPYVYTTDGRHDYEQVGKYIMEQGGLPKQMIHIEDDCWIGASTMIMRGITIGEGTVVGGMSVITKDLPPYTICVGNPCRPIKKRYTDNELLEHYRLLGKSPDQATIIIERRESMLRDRGINL